MLGDDAPGPNERTYSESRFVRPHSEKISTMDDGEIGFIKLRLGFPIPDQTGVAGPEHREAIREADDVSGFVSGVAGETLGNARISDDRRTSGIRLFQLIHVYP